MKIESQTLELAHPATVMFSALTGFVNKSKAFPFHVGSMRMAMVCAPILSSIASIIRCEFGRTEDERAEGLSDLHALCLSYVAGVWQYESSYAPCDIETEDVVLAHRLTDTKSEEMAEMLCRHAVEMHDGCIQSAVESLTMALAFFISKHVRPSHQSEYIFSLVAIRNL